MDIGETIQERYQTEEVLGQGSMGTTYKALDLKTQRSVAIKLLHFSRLQEWKSLELFEREAKILRQLNHPRIPTYIDFFSLETSCEVQFFLVQEYIEGKTLQRYVEEGWRGTEEEFLDVFLQLVDILDYLHSLNPPVIHRDINPKNIILRQFSSQEACPEPCPERSRRGVEGGIGVGSIYLVDFGAVQEKILSTFLGGSTIVGTFGYIPFEQFSGRTVPASDYYALGATLLYMLTHRHPSDFPTDDLKLQFHTFVQASPKIVRLLEGLLEPSVESRISSSAQVRKILEEASGKAQMQLEKLVKPSGTKIKKKAKESDHLTYHIPNKIRIRALLRFAFSLICLPLPVYMTIIFFLLGIESRNWAESMVSFLLLSIIWGIEIGMLIPSIPRVRGKTLLELTPEWISVKFKCFGINFSRRIPRIPTSALRFFLNLRSGWFDEFF